MLDISKPSILCGGPGNPSASAQMILTPNQSQRAPQSTGIREWTEVARAVVLFESGKGKPWNRVVKIYLQHQEPFVVAKTDVVTGMKFFNQLAFEQEGFGFA